jgi:hypothetical protein
MNMIRIVIFVVTVVNISLHASVTITKNTSKRLSFTFNMEDFSLSSFARNDSTFSIISFSGSNVKLVDDNDVVLPSVSLYTGVPPSGSAAIRFVSHEVKRIKLSHPLEIVDKTVGDPVEYISPPFDNPWVSNIKYVRLRNMRAGHFFIRPFIYEPGTRTLIVLLKGSCTITFPSAPLRAVSESAYDSDFYRVVKKLVLNFDIAKNWITSVIPLPAKRLFRTYLPSDEKMLKFTIGDGHTGYNETTTGENRVIKITKDDISGFFGTSVNMKNLVLYGSMRERLDSVVPHPEEIPPGVVEIPYTIVEDPDDGNDYLLAYVTGICDWYFDTALHDYEYTFNHYEDYRYYWLASGGRRRTMKRFKQPARQYDTTLSVFENRIRYKKSKELIWNGNRKAYGGIEWIWKRLTGSSPNFSFLFDPPSINTSYPGYLRIGQGNSDSKFNITVTFGDEDISDTVSWKTITDWGNCELNIDLDSNYNLFELMHLDFRYYQDIDMSGKQRLRIYSPPDSGILITYKLKNVSDKRIVIFRIPSDESKTSLVIDTTFTSAVNTYSWTDTGGIGIQYFVSTESGFDTGLELERYIPETNSTFEINLPKSSGNKADYLIVTHKLFEEEAVRLAEHKKNTGKFSYPKVIDVKHIFRDFSGGNKDPAAIRNFLLYTHNSSNWTEAPEYILLMGNGHYDYKGYKTSVVNFIPTIQMRIRTWFKCVEDFFGCINPGETVTDPSVSPSLFIGRITCVTKTEAENVVDKIIDMEAPEADFGPWRNSILLVSDDDRQGGGPDNMDHHRGNEQIEDRIKIDRPSMEVRKLYLFEYEWNDIYLKPEASIGLINEVNKGVSVVNYFGHGSEEAWADEYILTKDMVGNFNNYKKYPVILSFSCSVGRFDNLGKPCLSGLLVTEPGAGAIATISSARSAYAGENTNMALNFFNILYQKDSLNTFGQRPEPRNWTLGQAYMHTKAIENVNLKHYVYIGDPSIRHMGITDSVEMKITAIDDSPLHDTIMTIITDVNDTILDTLQIMMALQKIVIKGNIVRNGAINTSYGTTNNPDSIQIGLYNPEQDSVKRKDGGTDTAIYSLPGSPLFVGKTEVKYGQFRQEIFLPRRVPFKKYGVSLKAYAWDGKQYGTGYRDDIIFIGTDTLDVSDNTGPRISVRPVYENDTAQEWNAGAGFTDKICSTLPFGFEINLWDESGIDRTGTGPNEGLIIEIPGVVKQSLNDKFSFSEGKYTQGSASHYIQNGDMNPGIYDMIINAQDMLGNTSEATISLEILNPDDLKLYHTFNYPNPVRMGSTTKFYFYHSNTSTGSFSGLEATIKIYTLSGKLIRVFKSAKNGEMWNLTDQRGHALTPNVYLYRVTVKTLDTGYGNEKIIKSPIKKLVITPPG